MFNFLIKKPQTYYILVATFLFLSFQTNEVNAKLFIQSSNKVHENNHTSHNHNVQPTTQAKTITIRANDYRYTPDTINIKKGELIILKLINEDDVEHDFEIVGTDVHVHAQPNSEATFQFIADITGSFEAICTLPGHKDAGMVAKVKVQ